MTRVDWETSVSFGVALYAPGDTDNFQIFATHTEKHNFLFFF